MGYYHSGYEFAGIPVYIGTGVDDEIGIGDIPILSFGDMFHQGATEGRVDVSARDVLVHGLAYQALDIGAGYAMRKGFLDVSLFASRYGPTSINAARIGANRMLMTGLATGVRGVAPALTAYGLVYGLARGAIGFYHEVTGSSILPAFHVDVF